MLISKFCPEHLKNSLELGSPRAGTLAPPGRRSYVMLRYVTLCYVTLPDADGRTDEHEGLNSYVDSLESGIKLLWVKNTFFKISSQNLLLK